MQAIGFEKHDHTACVKTSLNTAETYCADNNLKLTPTRRRVLEILLCDHKSLGAYEILAQLNQEGLGSQPPVVYRALDFLVSHGFAHKIEKLNAYVACSQPARSHSPAFMICRVCDAVVEADSMASASLDVAASAAGFKIETTVVEAQGVCPACNEVGPSQ